MSTEADSSSRRPCDATEQEDLPSWLAWLQLVKGWTDQLLGTLPPVEDWPDQLLGTPRGNPGIEIPSEERPQKAFSTDAGNTKRLHFALDGTSSRKTLRDIGEQTFRDLGDTSTGLSLQHLKEAAESAGIEISESHLQALFEELDVNKDNSISFEEFQEGLKATPTLESVQGIAHLLESKNLAIMRKVAARVLERLAMRLEKKSLEHVDLVTVLGEVNANDFRQAWGDAQDEVVEAFEQEMRTLRSIDAEQGALTANKFNAKFASESGTFEGVYKDVEDFRAGVEGALGLPGNDIFEGMQMEFCSSEDSKDAFTTSNYGGTTTKPETEWEFVVHPDVKKQYGGGRTPVPLEVYLLASCAQKANKDETERHDDALHSLPEATRNAVKVVLLRRVKEVGMTKQFLSLAAKNNPGLKMLAASNVRRWTEIKRAMDAALRAGHSQPGLPSFDYIAAEVASKCGMHVKELEALVEQMRAALAEAKLTAEEVIALRLYTGPAFMKLNGTLREQDVSQKGNDYVCTIFATVSGMVKLAEISPIPEGRVVYRGQKGMVLPKCFWEDNAQGVRGGVEMAFLSTTSDMDTAVGYAASGSLATVFSIQVGAVDKGAALSFLSQYPDEDEILMPPRSFLEVVGEPRLIATSRNPVLSIPVKINCNLLCPTLEKLRGSRKTMLVSALRHIAKEVARDVEAAAESVSLKKRAQGDLFWKEATVHGGGEFLASLKREVEHALDNAKQRPALWYNVDVNFRRAMHTALEVQRQTMGKMQLWMEDRTLSTMHLNNMSAKDCSRMAAARLGRLIEEAGEAGEARMEAVLRLCKHLELIDQTVDETVDELLPTNGRETPLMRTAAEGQSGAVRLLLDARANAEAERSDGMTPLKLAAAYGHLVAAQLLVSKGGAAVGRQSCGEKTALMYAAQNGHAEVVEWLVEGQKADVDQQKKDGCTALMYAALNGHRWIVEFLVSHRADVHTEKEDGCTALMMAAVNGQEGVGRWLALQGAVMHKADKYGKTGLMLAAQNGHLDVVQWLARSPGAEVGKKDSQERTAALLAEEHGQREVAAWLVQLAEGRG